MNKLLTLLLISSLTLAGCMFPSDNQITHLKSENSRLSEENASLLMDLKEKNALLDDDLFKKAKECNALKEEIIKQKVYNDILMQIFYSPKLKSCLYVTKMEMIDYKSSPPKDFSTYFIYNYFEGNLVESTSFYQTLEKYIDELK